MPSRGSNLAPTERGLICPIVFGSRFRPLLVAAFTLFVLHPVTSRPPLSYLIRNFGRSSDPDNLDVKHTLYKSKRIRLSHRGDHIVYNTVPQTRELLSSLFLVDDTTRSAHFSRRADSELHGRGVRKCATAASFSCLGTI